MRKLMPLFAALSLLFAGTAHAASDADSPSIPCTGRGGQYVRVSFFVTLIPDHQEPGNGSIVDMKFSGGMAGKDVAIPFKDAQTLGAMLTLEGYCEVTLDGSAWLNTHWAYDSGVDGAAYTVTYGNVLSMTQLR